MNNSLFLKLRKFCLDFIILIIPLSVLIYLFPLIFKLIIPFIIAFLLYSLAKPLNHFLLKFHFPPFLASFLSLVLVASLFCGGVWLLFSSLIKELQGFSNKLTEIYSSVSETIYFLTDKISSYRLNLLSNETRTFSVSPQFLDSLISQLSEIIASFTASLLGYAKNIFGIFLVIFTSFLTAFFILKDKRSITSYLRTLMGDSLYKSCIIIKKRLFGVICGYLKAELLIGIIIFFLLLGGLFILNVEYSLLFALITAITDSVPILGAGTILIPWAIICLFTKNTVLGWGLISLYGVCLLTRQIVEPKLIGEKLGIHPLASIISIYIGMQLFGILGIIIGPILAVFIKSLLYGKFFQ